MPNLRAGMEARGGVMKPVFIEATTLGDAWFQLLYQVYHHGRKYLITKGSYEGGYRLEFDFVAGFIHHPHVRPLAPIMPEGIMVGSPTSDDEIDKYFNDYLMDSSLAPNEEYKYATWINGQIFDSTDITAIEWIIKHFKECGYGTNHCFLQVGYPSSNLAYDRSYINENERGTSPCLRGIDFKIVENVLVSHVYFRSWDLFSGFPTNMGGFVLLNEYVAYSLDGIEPGPLAFSSKGLHVYDFALEPLKSLLREG